MKLKNKFSIIVPVYNVENYIENCLDSIINQTYSNFECIIVCDKCSDNSEMLVDKYVLKDKRILKVYEENTGLAKAKNIGIQNATGDYLMFVDGDDFLEENALEIISKNLDSNVEMIRFQARTISDSSNTNYNEIGFGKMTGNEAFKKIIKYHFIENSWLYIYKKRFWDKYNFTFKENCIAEDFGLTPLIISKSNCIKSIENILYNYVQRANSLMKNTDYQKKVKKLDDMIVQVKNQREKFSNDVSMEINLFLNNSLIYYSTTLNYKDYKKYKKILKKMRVFDTLPNKTIKEKIKKVLIKNFTLLFYKVIAR